MNLELRVTSIPLGGAGFLPRKPELSLIAFACGNQTEAVITAMISLFTRQEILTINYDSRTLQTRRRVDLHKSSKRHLMQIEIEVLTRYDLLEVDSVCFTAEDS